MPLGEGLLQKSLCRDSPEEDDVLPQLLDRPLLLDVGVCVKAVDEGVYDAQLVQGLCLGLQGLVAASHRLGTLQSAHAKHASLMTAYSTPCQM